MSYQSRRITVVILLLLTLLLAGVSIYVATQIQQEQSSEDSGAASNCDGIYPPGYWDQCNTHNCSGSYGRCDPGGSGSWTCEGTCGGSNTGGDTGGDTGGNVQERTVPGGGACTPGGVIECISGVCCSCPGSSVCLPATVSYDCNLYCGGNVPHCPLPNCSNEGVRECQSGTLRECQRVGVSNCWNNSIGQVESYYTALTWQDVGTCGGTSTDNGGTTNPGQCPNGGTAASCAYFFCPNGDTDGDGQCRAGDEGVTYQWGSGTSCPTGSGGCWQTDYYTGGSASQPDFNTYCGHVGTVGTSACGGGTVTPQSVTCYRCTTSLSDGNTCEAFTQSGTTCPSGTSTSPTGCAATAPGGVCATQICGDGVVNPGEQCDDGNTDNGDGCSSTCTVEIPPLCGDGDIDPGEECDDGNNNNNDGCSANCNTESTVVCGGACDPQNGIYCPANNSCSNGTCVSNTCLGDPSRCGADMCTLLPGIVPTTSVFGDSRDYLIYGGIAIMLGILAYIFGLPNRSVELLTQSKFKFVFAPVSDEVRDELKFEIRKKRKEIEQKGIAKERDRFEDRFEE